MATAGSTIATDEWFVCVEIVRDEASGGWAIRGTSRDWESIAEGVERFHLVEHGEDFTVFEMHYADGRVVNWLVFPRALV
jgi:hypothetical protein